MGIFLLVIFWLAVIYAFSSLGAKAALFFAGLWVLGLIVVSVLHLNGLFFLAYEAILAAILLIRLKIGY